MRREQKLKVLVHIQDKEKAWLILFRPSQPYKFLILSVIMCERVLSVSGV